MTWVGGINSTLLPTVIFVMDTYGFCMKYSYAEVAVFLVYSIFCMLCCFLGPTWFDKLDVFKFYVLPLSFGWRLYPISLGCMIVYWGVHLSVIVWNRQRQHQVSPAQLQAVT